MLTSSLPKSTSIGGPQPATCSFCNRRSPDTGTVFTGPGVPMICEHCVEQAHAILQRAGSGVVRGAPPDPDRARAEIAEAFARLEEKSGPGGEDLPFVEGGAGLGTYQSQAGGIRGIREAVGRRPGGVRSATLAEVRFRITGFMEMLFVGTAVVDEGRWKARDTLAGLSHGVFIPPRAA